MNSANTKRLPLSKLFGKLRRLIVVVPQGDVPHRSWDSAAAREIQLEFDFERRKRAGERKNLVSALLTRRPESHVEHDKPWGREPNC